eukprot:4388849-Pyramimonas_sp.AAC.1
MEGIASSRWRIANRAPRLRVSIGITLLTVYIVDIPLTIHPAGHPMSAQMCGLIRFRSECEVLGGDLSLSSWFRRRRRLRPSARPTGQLREPRR